MLAQTLKGPQVDISISLHKNPCITWSSKQQPTVSHSTIEDEYRATLSESVQERVYLKRLIQELQQIYIPSTNLKCTSLQIANELKTTSTSTQQDIHWHYDNMSAIKLACKESGIPC